MTTRAHVRTVVTEYGVAELYGRSLRERASPLDRRSPIPTIANGFARRPGLSGLRRCRAGHPTDQGTLAYITIATVSRTFPFPWGLVASAPLPSQA